MSSLRAQLPKASQAKGTGGRPWAATESSIRRAVMASESTVSTRMTAGASRCASSKSTNRWGTSAAAFTRSSCVADVCSERRSANGLRESSVMRLLAERMPTTSPSASSTGRWLTPEAIMAMLASGARTSAPMVCTGEVMILVTGSSRDMPRSTTLSRKSTSVTIPRPSRRRTSMALRLASESMRAASRMGVSELAEQAERCAPARSPAGCARRAARAWRASPE